MATNQVPMVPTLPGKTPRHGWDASLGALLLVVAGLLPATAPAQYWDPAALAADPRTATAPIAPRLTGLGPLLHPIDSTDSDASREFFRQGMNLVYAYNHGEALRSFKEAARLDPGNPMAWWGQALALGPNLNLPMQPEAIAPAFAAVREARRLAGRAEPVERALIEALAERYSADPGADRAALDARYAEALGRVMAEYPDHLGVATLYADALMNRSPWNYWTPDGQPREHTSTVLATLQSVLARNPDHIGALHLYIHAVEAQDPDRGAAAADRLRPLTPGAGHLVHMPAHIYMQVGRYADAYAVNVEAAAADAAYLAQCRAQGIYPLLYFPHNEHFKVWAALFEGRSATALADARQMAAHVPHEPTVFGLAEVFAQQPLYVLARFGRWDDVLREPAPRAESRLATALWHYARGLAYRFKGDRRAAERELKALRAIRAEPGLAEAYTAFSPTTVLIDIAGEILAGEIALARGRSAEGIAHLDRAVRLQDGLTYNEPPDWFFPVRHYLGAALLDAGLAREAEAVYWQDLAKNRENGYALLGLGQALAAQGRDAEAADLRARYARAFARADVQLGSSRY